MDKKDTPNTTSWLALLQKKVNKKFKRNRQKLSNCDEVPQEPEIVEQEIEPQIPESSLATSSSTNGFSTQDCATMKKELIKVAWYWPGLSRLDAQKLLSSSQNGSFVSFNLILLHICYTVFATASSRFFGNRFVHSQLSNQLEDISLSEPMVRAFAIVFDSIVTYSSFQVKNIGYARLEPYSHRYYRKDHQEKSVVGRRLC